MATEPSPTKKRMRETEDRRDPELTASELMAEKENEKINTIQTDFFRTVKAKFEDALVALEEAEKDVFAELYKWKAREIKKK